MSVTATTLLYRGQTGRRSNDSSKEYTAKYGVTVDSATDGAAVVIAGLMTSQSLTMGGSYSFGGDSDSAAKLDSLTPTRTDSRLYWEVAATWKTPEDEETDEDGNTSDDPLDWVAEYDISFSQSDVPIWKAIVRQAIQGHVAGDEIPMKNSAGEIFNPPPTKQEAVMVIRTSYNAAAFPDAAHDNVNLVNTDTVTLVSTFYGLNITILPFQARLVQVGGSFKKHISTYYWDRTYEIHVKKDGWRYKVLDKGLHRIVEAGGPDGFGGTYSATDILAGMAPLERIKGPDGHAVVAPVMLDGQGQPKAADDPAVYITYSVYPEGAYGPLGIFAL